MTNNVSNEFTFPSDEFSRSSEEITRSSDTALTGLSPEFNDFGKEIPATTNKTTEKAEEKRLKRKKTFLLQMAAVAVAGVVTANSFGLDLLGGDVLFSGLSSESSSDYYSVEASAQLPLLNNLMPNYAGDLPYIDYEADSSYYRYQLTSSVSSDTFTVLNPGISYNQATNVLTLNNVTSSVLEINDFGNGLILDVHGLNRIGYLKIYGFYYGGSVQIKGDGTLLLNEGLQYPVGLHLEAECSDTFLYVDDNVIIDSYGSEAAILISATNLRESFYISPNQKVHGGMPKREKALGFYSKSIGAMDLLGTLDSTYSFYFEDSASPSKHVIIISK